MPAKRAAVPRRRYLTRGKGELVALPALPELRSPQELLEAARKSCPQTAAAIVALEAKGSGLVERHAACRQHLGELAATRPAAGLSSRAAHDRLLTEQDREIREIEELIGENRRELQTISEPFFERLDELFAVLRRQHLSRLKLELEGVTHRLSRLNELESVLQKAGSSAWLWPHQIDARQVEGRIRRFLSEVEAAHG